MKRVLITGGAGYVGSVLCQRLLTAGHQVTVFDKLQFGIEPLVHLLDVGSRLKCVNGDIRDRKVVAEALKGQDVVLHLAAIVGFPACAAEPAMAEEVNIWGSRNVAEQISPDQTFVYASTGSTYGLVNGICTEETPISPLSHYGRTKAEAEKICRAAGAVCLRFATVFGASPCMRFDLLVNSFVFQAIHKKYLMLYEGGHKRTFVHVRDAAESYLVAINNWPAVKGVVFNVGDNALNLTKRQVADAISKVYPVYVHEASVGKDADCRDYQVDYSKFSALGFHGTVDLADGIKEIGELAKLVKIENRWRTE